MLKHGSLSEDAKTVGISYIVRIKEHENAPGTFGAKTNIGVRKAVKTTTCWDFCGDQAVRHGAMMFPSTLAGPNGGAIGALRLVLPRSPGPSGARPAREVQGSPRSFEVAVEGQCLCGVGCTLASQAKRLGVGRVG